MTASTDPRLHLVFEHCLTDRPGPVRDEQQEHGRRVACDQRVPLPRRGERLEEELLSPITVELVPDG